MTDRTIGAYDAAFDIETEMHTIGDKQLPRPIPARNLVWGVFWVVVMLILHRFPVVSSMSWVVAYVAIPIVLSSVCAAAKIEGRRLHTMLISASQYVFAGGTTTAGGTALKRGKKHKAPKLRVIRERGGS